MTRLCDFISKLPDMLLLDILLLDILMLTNHLPRSLMMEQIVMIAHAKRMQEHKLIQHTHTHTHTLNNLYFRDAFCSKI